MTLSPESVACIGTLRPDGNSSVQFVSAAVNVYLVTEVSLPVVGVATTSHFPAKSAIVAVGGGGVGAAAAAGVVVSFEACSALLQATNSNNVPPVSATRRENCIVAPCQR